MTATALQNRKIAVLATDGFEQEELEKPIQALKGHCQSKCIGPSFSCASAQFGQHRSITLKL